MPKNSENIIENGVAKVNTEGVSRDFNYSLDFKNTNFREQPQLYRIGRGEQGVLLVEPYKSEILPHWRFKTEEIARISAAKIYTLLRSIYRKTTSWEQICRVNICKWASPEPDVMPITKEGKSTVKEMSIILRGCPIALSVLPRQS